MIKKYKPKLLTDLEWAKEEYLFLQREYDHFDNLKSRKTIQKAMFRLSKVIAKLSGKLMPDDVTD